jgi:oligopeptide/dipeptide ABC transporter ATP-binding protein
VTDGSGACQSLLSVEGLSVEYTLATGIRDRLAGRRKRVHAVDGVSLALDRGEFVALVGESGCGKTTLAQAILRMVEPSAGRVHFEGRDLTGVKQGDLRATRRRLQMIYQDPYESLDPRFRVSDTLQEPLKIHRAGMGEVSGMDRAREALALAGLTPPDLYLGRYPHELSGGQRQRVAIATALMLEPGLIVADEPVSMLDMSLRAGILKVFDQLRRSGLAVLMITHDLSTAATYADRIYVMYLGRVVETGPAKSVVRRPQHPYTQALISVIPRSDPDERRQPQILHGEAPNPVAVPSGCRFHPRCPRATEECAQTDPLLRSTGIAGHVAACIRLRENEEDV